jgi:Flp pilus assembly pilin Flp
MGRQRMVRQRMVRRSLDHLWRLWHEDEGQDIAEYAVMLAVILVIVVGTIRLIGSNANNVFSNVASSIQ